MSPDQATKWQRRETIRRAVVLAMVLAGLCAGLVAFHARQSLITHFAVSDVTRVLIPARQMVVPASARAGGRALAVPVLVYHGIQPKGTSCNVTPETFRQHMLALKRAGYTTLTMREFEEFIAGSRSIPERSVLITFDDGRTDSFVGADPVFSKLGFKATMFTILGRAGSGKPFYLTEAETKMMARTGRWDVESHTARAHQYIPTGPMGGSGPALSSRLWNTELGRLESDREYELRVAGDLEEAARGLTELSGRRVTAFAYPWGDFGKNAQDPMIKERLPELVAAYYPYSFSQAGPTIDETYNYPFDQGSILRRVYISYDMTAEDLMERLERGMPKTLPFVDSASLASPGWARSTGDLSGDAGHERSCSAASNGRAEVFLDGSRAWEDYVVNARFSLQTSETVSVIARRSGHDDYLAATVSRTYVSIEQVRADESTTVAEADVSIPVDPLALHDVAFSVQGSEAWLQIDGIEVMRVQGVDPALERGGVGMRIDTTPGKAARLKLSSFEVHPLARDLAAADQTDRSAALRPFDVAGIADREWVR